MDTREITSALPKFLIRLYQAARQGSVPRCRFFPSCSEYMLDAFEAKGFWKGLGFGMRRILKCHPWHPGGYNPLGATSR